MGVILRLDTRFGIDDCRVALVVSCSFGLDDYRVELVVCCSLCCSFGLDVYRFELVIRCCLGLDVCPVTFLRGDWSFHYSNSESPMSSNIGDGRIVSLGHMTY